MTAIMAIVKARIITGQQTQLRSIAQILAHYAAGEPDCEQYQSYIDGEDFLTIECWQSQAALDQHLQTAHVAQYVPKLRACVEGGRFSVQFIRGGEVQFCEL